MKLERIIPEIKTLTTGIYYKEFQKLIDYLTEIPDVEIKKHKIICQEYVYNECFKIGNFFKVKTLKSNNLPTNVLITIVNWDKIMNENMNIIG